MKRRKCRLPFWSGFILGLCVFVAGSALFHGCEGDRIVNESGPSVAVVDTVTVLPSSLPCDSCHHFHPHPWEHRHH